MRRLIERCAGLDVHRDTVAACVRVPGDGGERYQEVRTFRTTTVQLEDHVECWLLNAEHLHNVPGRKTDVADSVWICELTEHGLVRPSFVPPKPIRVLRDLTRYRTVVARERGHEIQRLHKVLEDAGIKLSSVASKVLTASGRDMIEALVAGTRDPEVLAEMARGRMRPKIPQLVEALQGRFGPEHALVATRMLARIDHAEEVVTSLSAQIKEVIAPWEARWAEVANRPRHGPVRYLRPPGLVGRDVPGQQRVGRQAPV